MVFADLPEARTSHLEDAVASEWGKEPHARSASSGLQLTGTGTGKGSHFDWV